jgi:hypothetical protein
MGSGDDAYRDAGRIELHDLETIEHWANIWGVPTLSIMNAIRKVGPLLRDVSVEIWREAEDWKEDK